MSKYEGRRASEDDVVDLAQWAPYPPNRRTSFIQSLLNYVRVPYTRVVVVEKRKVQHGLQFALLWLKHSAVTQTHYCRNKRSRTKRTFGQRSLASAP